MSQHPRDRPGLPPLPTQPGSQPRPGLRAEDELDAETTNRAGGCRTGDGRVSMMEVSVAPRAAGRTKARVKKLGPKWKEISEVIFMVGPAVWHLSWLVTILFIQRDSKKRRLVPGMLGPVNTS